jgi:hypothetical protein
VSVRDHDEAQRAERDVVVECGSDVVQGCLIAKPRKPFPTTTVMRSLLIGSLLVVACGGKSARLEASRCGPRQDLTAEKLEVRRALCERNVGCGVFTDVETCERVTTTGLAIFDAAESGCVNVHPARLPACLDALRAAGCTSSDLWSAIDAACLAPFEGRLETGERCESDAECSSGACALMCNESCCEAQCRTRNRELGDECEYSEDCVEGTFCDQGACAPMFREGEPCSEFGARTCEEPLWCIAGVCTTPPRAGDACDRSALIRCDEIGAVCDEATSTCVRFASVGEPCAGDGQGCIDSATCREGICAPLPGLFEPCDEGRCLGDLRCGADERCAPSKKSSQPTTLGVLACP